MTNSAAFDAGRHDAVYDRSMDKIAIDPLTLGLGAAASHLGANIAGKWLHATKRGRSVLKSQLARGIRRGSRGLELGNVSRGAAKNIMGPEMLISGDIGERVGGIFKGMSKRQKFRAMKKARKRLAMSEGLRGAPHVENVIGGLTRAIDNPKMSRVSRAMSQKAGKKAGIGSRLATGAITSAAAAAEPGLIPHIGFNYIRSNVLKMKKGREIAIKEFQQGLRGERGNRALDLAKEILISPSYNETRDMGLAARRLARSRGLDTSVAGNVDVKGLMSNKKLMSHLSELKSRVLGPGPGTGPAAAAGAY